MGTKYGKTRSSDFGTVSGAIDPLSAARLIQALRYAVTVCTSIRGGAWNDNNGVNPNLVPEDGRSWSVGMDFKPTSGPDLTLKAT